MVQKSGESPEAGRVVDGKYRLEEVVAEGDHSVTYRARHTGIERTVELKTLPPTLPADGPHAAALLTEARAAGSVAHRNVRSVVDSGVDEAGRPFVVYEALEGVSVSDLLRDNPRGLPPDRAARVTMGLLEALSAVHRGGVVHRGVGPDTIRVVAVRGGEELVKLADFGNAVFAHDADAAVSPRKLQEAPYVSPKLRRGSGVEPSVDLYAAGVVLRALLTGSPNPGNPISDTARRAIERAVAARPEEQFADADAFLAAVSLVTGTSDRPPRDELALSGDALVADLDYLLQRRSVAGGPPAPKSSARLQLMAVLLLIEAAYKALGAKRWGEIVTRVPGVEDFLPGSGQTDDHLERGVPLEVIGSVLDAGMGLTGRGHAFVVDLGEKMAHRGLARLVPGLPEPLTPSVLVGRFGDLWAAICRAGDVRILELGPGAARLAVVGVPTSTVSVCGLVAGLVRGSLRAAGHTVAVRVTACTEVGDAACVFVVRWSS